MSTPPPIEFPAYYLARAAECDTMAALAESADIREVMLGLAKRWRSLADRPVGAKRTVGSGTVRNPGND
jgi:hypothetical protein